MVGISLLTLVPGVVGGSETYVRGLCRGLRSVGSLDYEALLPTIAPDAAEGLTSRVVESYRASMTTAGRAIGMAAAALRPERIRKELGLERFSAIHFPLTIMLPEVDEPPALVTIHDLQHERFPRFFPRYELAYRRRAYRRAARRSELIIVPSEFVKRTLVEHLQISAARIRVIHLGIDHERFQPGSGEREEFLLYPANRWAHKNHAGLFEALALLRRRQPGLRLVLTGSGHDGAPAPDGVDVRGRVSAEELRSLYQRACCLVFPSLYEGFGAPPLEAMACGCPVAASNVASIPEIVGDAGVLFDPTSPGSIADGVEQAMDDPGLVERGLARAAGFTWEQCARDHDAAYREVMRGS